MHIYEVRPRRDKPRKLSGLPFGRLWYGLAEDAVGYAKFYSRSHAMIVRVFDESGGLIKTHESQSAFREVAVFGIPDPKWGEIVKAVVVLKPGKTLTAEELRRTAGDPSPISKFHAASSSPKPSFRRAAPAKSSKEFYVTLPGPARNGPSPASSRTPISISTSDSCIRF
jgi:hypothetical protein